MIMVSAGLVFSSPSVVVAIQPLVASVTATVSVLLAQRVHRVSSLLAVVASSAVFVAVTASSAVPLRLALIAGVPGRLRARLPLGPGAEEVVEVEPLVAATEVKQVVSCFVAAKDV